MKSEMNFKKLLYNILHWSVFLLYILFGLNMSACLIVCVLDEGGFWGVKGGFNQWSWSVRSLIKVNILA